MTSQPLLEARGLVKTFGRVQALRGASFAVQPGEVVALIGGNGAGKTVLVKCLSGVLRPDAGEIAVDGRPVELESPLVAMGCGIETVYQDLALADDLEASANLYLGRELLKPGPLGWLGVLDRRRMRAEALRALEEVGVALQHPTSPVVALSGGERQGVALARSMMWVSKVVLLDEPAAALGVGQRRQLLDVVRRLRDRGVAVVYVSHSAPEALEVADRIEVLRLGQRVARFQAGEATLDQLAGAMTGPLGRDDAA